MITSEGFLCTIVLEINSARIKCLRILIRKAAALRYAVFIKICRFTSMSHFDRSTGDLVKAEAFLISSRQIRLFTHSKSP